MRKKQHTPLRAYRVKNCLSMEEMGELLDVDASTICRWETGERKPALKKLPLIEQRIGLSPEQVRPDIYKVFGG